MTRPGDLTDDEWWEPQRLLQEAATEAARDAYRPRLQPSTPKDDD
jgi:hypothetical protein